MSGKPGRSGRPPKPPVDPSTLDLLTIPQALVYLRQMSRPIGRAKLSAQIATGRLRVLVDVLHHDRYGNPLLMIERATLDRWLRASLVPLQVAPISA